MKKRWGEQNLREVSKSIQDTYQRIVFWKKNLFMLPTDASANKYIAETTKLMKASVYCLRRLLY